MNDEVPGKSEGQRFKVPFAPTIAVLPASKLVCWFQNSSASGFVAACCDRYCALFGAGSRRAGWRGAWRWVWWSVSIRLWD